MKRVICTVLIAWLYVVSAPVVRAATVDLNALTAVTHLQAGDIVTLEISFQMPVPVFGGGFDLMFDETQLELVGITESLIGEPDLSTSPDYVPGSGLISRWSIFSFSPFTSGVIGFVDFQVRDGASSTSVALGPTQGIPWLDANDLGNTIVEPAYGSITLTAVPLPASVWLLGGALVALARCRKPCVVTEVA